VPLTKPMQPVPMMVSFIQGLGDVALKSGMALRKLFEV